MQKYVAVLEKNVEWIALSLAGLWVLWLVWAYGISQPVSVTIDGQTHTAATIDPMIQNIATTTLQPKINSQAVPTLPKADIVVLDRMEPVIPGQIGALAIWSPPARALQPINDQGGIKLQPDVKIAALPEIPVIRLIDIQSDRDQVIMSQQVANPSTQPADAQAAAAPAPAAPADAPPVDKYWVTLFGKFSEKDLDAAFKNAKIPSYLSSRTYLAVQLVRQEMLPDGSWGAEKEIAPLAMNKPAANRVTNPAGYMAWAMLPENQLLIIQPPFYLTVNNKWLGGPPPKVKPAEAAQAAVAFDPAAIAQGIIAKDKAMIDLFNSKQLTPQQKAQVTKIRQQLEEEARRQKMQSNPNRQNTNRPNPGMRPMGPGFNRAAQDPNALRDMYAQATPAPGQYPPGMYPPGMMRPGMYPPGMMRPGMYPNMMRPGMYPPGMMRPGMYPPGMAPGMYPGMYPGMNQFPGAALPPGAPNVVRPSDGAQNSQLVEFDVWAHDETVEPGKVYRYRMRLVVRNPVYNMKDAVTDPALAKPMELPNDSAKSWSEWTKPIEVKPRVQMFLAGGATGKDLVRFDVYRWQNGKVNKTAQSVAVSPGDMVGGIDKASGIDFSTGWSVVDIRQVGNSDWRVTLVDDSGMQKTRYLKADSSDANRKELEKDAQAAAEAAKAAAALGGTANGANGATDAGATPPTNPAQ